MVNSLINILLVSATIMVTKGDLDWIGDYLKEFKSEGGTTKEFV